MEPHRLMSLVISLVLVLAILAVYGQVGRHAFVSFDTPDYITGNPFVKAGLTHTSIVWAFTTTHAANWHPVTWLSHMADVQLFGLNPGAHHMSNVLLHIFNTLLLFLAFKRMTGRMWPSAFVGALFALHPLHVESVAWAAERKDLLCMFFGLLAIMSYARYAARPAPGRYLLVVLFLILGLMSKPMLVTFPFVLLLLDYWPLRRLVSADSEPTPGRVQKQYGLSFLILEKVPLLLIAVTSGLVTLAAQHMGGAVRTLTAYPLSVRVGNALAAYVAYIGKMLWPVGLAFFYPHEKGSLSVWAIAGAVAILVIVTGLAVKTLRRHPYIMVGWLWYLGTLVPVIGIVQVGLQARADRYAYIPLVGLYLVAAFGFPDLVAGLRARRYLLAGLAIGLLLALGVRSWHQVGFWQDSEHLYRHALAVTRNNFVAYKNLGLVLAEKGEVEAALQAYASAIDHHPYPHSVYFSAGNALLQINRAVEAERYYRQALKVKPDYAMAYYGLGLLAAQAGRTDEALANYKAAVRYDPELAEAQLNLGVVYLSQGKLEAALQHLQQALAIDPFMAQAHNNIGLAQVRQGRLEQALFHFQKAVAFKPDYGQAQNNLRRVQADQVRIAGAVADLQADLKSVKAQGEASPDLLARVHRRHAELQAALNAFRKAMTAQPGFRADSLKNVTGVAEVLATYDQVISKPVPGQPDNRPGAAVKE